MTAVPINLLGRGEVARMADQTASGATAIDIEIQPDAACFVDLAITKPTGCVCSAVLAYGGGAAVPLFETAEATVETAIEILDVQLAVGDELRVDLDGTSGAKTVSAKARRIG